MNNNESLVSIVIPVYNVEKYLRKCLDSIVNQTYKNIEIICVDDGSSDNSLNILKDFGAKDSRIKIIKQRNQGVSVARNKGIDNTSGRYLMFVDSDDWIESNMIEELYTLAIKENSDVVISGLTIETGKDIDLVVPSTPSKWFARGNLLTSVSNKFHRTQVIKENNIKYNPEIKMAEDFLFNMEVLVKSKKVTVFPKSFYHYILHGENTIFNLEKRADTFIALKLIYDVLNKNSFLEDFSNKKEFERMGVIYSKSAFSKLIYAKNYKEFKFFLKQFLFIVKEQNYLPRIKKTQVYIRAFVVYCVFILHLKKCIDIKNKIKKKLRSSRGV